MEIPPNSCRICLTLTQADERQLLVQDGNLTTDGELYEDFLGLPVVMDGMILEYVCNTCDLQLKLFKELKLKALDTQLLLNKSCETSKVENNPNEQVSDLNVDLKTELIEVINDDEEFTILEEVEFLMKGCESHIDDLIEEDQYIDEERLSNISGDAQDEKHSVEASETTEDSKITNTNGRFGNDIYHPCPNCKRKFRTKMFLRNHIKIDHPKVRKYNCPICPKTMHSEEALEVHLNIHNGLPAYQCKLCEKTFNQKVHYTYHMMNHENVRNKVCEVCHKKFISKSDLKIHMRIHTDERRYKCDICEKTFLAHTHMVNHRYSHFEKQFECPSCFQMYISPNTLRTHYRTVHIGVIPFECEFCEKKFKRKHHLHAHYKTHNKSVETIVIENQT